MFRTFVFVCSLSVLSFGQTAPKPEVRGYAVLFVTADPNGQSVALMKAPDGKLALAPLTEIKDYLQKGYRSVTAGDLGEEEAAYQTAVNNLQTQLDNLSKSYQQLSQDFDATVRQSVGKGAVGYQPPPQPAAQDTRLARYLALQSLLSKPSQTINLNVSNCNASPALCVH